MKPRTSPALVWFWRVYVPVAALAVAAVLGAPVGAIIEAWASPIFTRGDVSAASIVRADGYLCWTWVTDKLRASAAEDIDAVLARPAIGDMSWPEVIDARTRHPWHRLGSRQPDKGLRYDSCVRLPDDLGPGEPVTLTQTLFYPSAWGPWRVAVHPPDVVSPGRPPP